MDENLDDMLKRRHVPEPPSNLSARIIEMSKTVPQDLPWYKRLRFASLAFDMRTPALAFAVFALVMIGAVFVSLEQPQQIDDDVSLAFYLDDIFYVSEL